MDISAALAEDLDALSQATGVDQRTALSQLGRGLELAVASYLGLSLTLVTLGQPVTFTAVRNGSDAVEVQASLHFPLDLLSASDPSSTLTIYAGVRGAFVDLAADLGWLADPGASRVRLDQHLAIAPVNGTSSLSDFSTVNQAAGVLIAAGFDPADAYAEIDARAARGAITRVDVARQILDSL